MSNYNPQQDVSNFMTACGQEVKTSPGMPDSETRLLRAKLLFEEVEEFIEAAGCWIGINEEGKFQIYLDAEIKPNLQEMYDAIVDINYVSYGAGSAIGVNVQLGHEEVHRSNMSKLNPDGTATKNAFGKVQKSSLYTPPDLKSVLESQMSHKG